MEILLVLLILIVLPYINFLAGMKLGFQQGIKFADNFYFYKDKVRKLSELKGERFDELPANEVQNRIIDLIEKDKKEREDNLIY